MTNLKKVALTTIVALGLSSCSQVPISGRKQVNLLPESQMMTMSLTQYQTFLTENPPMANSLEQTKLVKKVGNRIALAVQKYLNQNKMSGRIKGYNWEFNLVNENLVNAWCMPGGKVVVYAGILPVTQTEAGLAVVMGHEIAHAIARHGNERMSQGMIANGLTGSLSSALKVKPGLTGSLFQTAMGLGTKGVVLKFGRNQESEADKMGMVFMAMAGYPPSEAIPFWGRMKAAGGNDNTPEFMRTHPGNDLRISRIKEFLPTAESYYVPQ